MEGPIVSIDVSNGNSHYMCFIKNNKRFGKVKKIVTIRTCYFIFYCQITGTMSRKRTHKIDKF
mgnify:CR=1 FL=1